ncbi:UPF0719 inner membrane protein yjfL [Escherichia coli UMEA 3899-1]|nr:UPF0719 inner membrane protein yjfL [Escherichia coli UMEA 3899-1]
MSGSAFAVTHHAFSSGAGRTSDGNGSHASTLKSPSYTKSVSWQHYPLLGYVIPLSSAAINAVSIPDYFAWGGIALVIQLLVFAGVRLYMPALSEKIINHNTAAGMFMGTAALAGGIFNAACMTW